MASTSNVLAMNIVTKIGVLVAGGLAISLLVQVFYAFPQIRSREFGLQRVQNLTEANSIASEIKDFLDSIHYELEMLAMMPEIKSMDVKQQNGILSLSAHTSPRFDTVYIGIADSNGVVTSLESRNQAVISSKSEAPAMDISDRDYFKFCRYIGETYYADPFEESVFDLIVATIATPIKGDDESVVGVLFVGIPLEAVTSIIESRHLDETESVYIVDRKGSVIAHSEKYLTQLFGSPLRLDYSDYTVVQDLVDGRSGVGEYEYDGETYVAFYMVIEPSGWGVVFQEPHSVLVAKSYVMTNFLLGINAAVFVAAVLVSLLFARRVTNPLRRLAEYAGTVERGDYTAELDVKGSDEIADVTSAIKSMVNQMVSMQEKELAAIVNSMRDGLIVLDQNERVTRLNPYMEQMLGVRAAEVLNKSISELKEDPRLRPLARVAEAESPDDEVVFTQPYERVLKVHSSTLKSGKDKDLGEVKVILDVTQERELDQMKSDFIANTSHELRTPLHSIRGFVKLILDGKVPDTATQREFLSIVDEQSEHLSNLVSSILDTAAMESGEMVFEMQPVSMNEVIDKVVVKLRKIADDKEIAVEADLPGKLPPIEGDAEKLEQVITNLVHNAIKFSPKGNKVHVAARAENNSMLVQVIDHGIGISAGAIPHVFEKFFKVHGSMPWASSGTGLGLYIVKQIVEAHGGEIWVESKLNEGSTFSFKLPLSHGKRDKQQQGG